jgi:hypothetical protein
MSIAQRSPTWKNEKHRKQWASTLEQYAYKSLGSRRAASIDAKLINDTLAHIWTTKQETASRVKQRIERRHAPAPALSSSLPAGFSKKRGLGGPSVYGGLASIRVCNLANLTQSYTLLCDFLAT